MSFAFVARDAVTENGVRELREVTLYDVSVVTYPWYEATSVGLTGDRNMDRALVSLRALTPEQRAEVLAEVDPPAEVLAEVAPVEEPRTFTIAEARALLDR
jgi:phage head maturation protease